MGPENFISASEIRCPNGTLLSVAQVAELVDALVSGTSAERRGGSSPLLGPNHKGLHIVQAFIFCGAQAHVNTLTCQMGCATKSWPSVPTMRAEVNSPTFMVLLIFCGGNKRTTPSISGASAYERPTPPFLPKPGA